MNEPDILLPGGLHTAVAGFLVARRMEVQVPFRNAVGLCVIVHEGHATLYYPSVGERREPLNELAVPVRLNSHAILDWLARHCGVRVGLDGPSWRYKAAGECSVASWTLEGLEGSRYVFCDYPEDIERTNGPPIDHSSYANVRGLPSGALAALARCCLHVARVL